MEKMINQIKTLYLKYKEIINYIFFGGCTFVVNFVSYFILTNFINIDEVISNMIAWVISVLFAYITNKLFVFESKTEGFKATLKELVSFFLARIVSGILCDVGTFALMIRVLQINDIIAKIVTQIMVIIMNYVFSKLIIFRKSKERTKENEKSN